MRRLLLVEDDTSARRAFALLLRRTHFVDEAETVAEAKRLLRAHRHDRAVIEVWLPDGNGLDLLGWIRRQPTWCDVLVLTGDADGALANRAFLLGAPFIRKPHVAEPLRRFAEQPASRASEQPIAERVRTWALAHRLSARQTELLVHHVVGADRGSLATRLSLKETTVRTMIREVLRKTQRRTLQEVQIAVLRSIVGMEREAT